MTMYEGYHYWGMHLVWWFVWIVFIVWIFATPYYIPGRRSRIGTPLDLLKNRLALGEIDHQEYLEKKKLLDMK